MDNELAGAVIGSLKQGALWIKLLAVAPELRRMGFGSLSAEMLMMYFREMNYAAECYLSVVEENETGRLFWLKNGFREVSRLEKHRLFDGFEHNIIIMQKTI
jgi:ribosomal protein S18 acetylase RimI-like enzyme